MAYMNMKKSTIITALVAILSMAVIPMFAQEENGFKKFDVREDFTENGMLHPLNLSISRVMHPRRCMPISLQASTLCISAKL
jgi:hypothetical protein